MKKKLGIVLISIIFLLCLAFSLSACAAKVEFKVSFVVDGQTVHTINTNGNEVIAMPLDPQKDDYIFDGWYWDKNVWEKPFTANSLLDAPLSSNMNVYCKWRPEHEHAFTQEVIEDKYKASDASCTEKAKYYYSCECGEKVTETFEYGELVAHTPKATARENEVDSTCLAEGHYDEVIRCDVCDGVISSTTKTIDKKQHTESVLQSKSATCTENGLTEGKECSVCHTVLVAQEIIPAAHTEETITGKAATCTETGLTDGKKCSVCKIVLQEQTTIPLKEHTEETIAGKPASCTEDGLTDGKKCSVCQTVLVEQETTPAAHVASAWITDKTSTCTENGSKHKECTVCGSTLTTEEIALAPHTETTIYGKLPTCTNSGLTNGRLCSVCGTTTAEQTVIPATGHKFENGVCLSCDIEESPATISEVKGGTVNELDIYMFVEHDVTEVNLLRIVTCSPKSTWKLYEDKRGRYEIATKIASGENDELNNGDNVFYIVATSANGIDVNTYTLTIYRSYEITVKYYNAGVLDKTDNVYTGHDYTADYAPEYRGYTFNHWKNGDERFTNAVLWDNLTLDADKTAKTYTVSFVTDDKAQAVEGFTATYDQEVTLPASSKTGYTFNGWLDGGEISENTFVWQFIENKEYTAKFTANQYTITYISNGGTIESTTQTVTYDGEYTLYDISRLGYTFEGYIKGDEEFTNGVYTIADDVTINAEWKIITYTITYHFDESTTNDESNPATYTVEDSVTFAKGAKTGYTFNGWYTEAGYANAITKIDKGTIGDKVLYAKTTANRYTVTITKNDADAGSVSGAGVHYYDDIVTISATTVDGYNFIGWYDSEDCLLSDESTYVFDMGFDITIVAKWNYYTLTTTKNSGEAGTVTNYNNTKVSVGNSVTITAETAIGHTFVGWYDGEREITKELSYTFTMPAENITYTAKWIKITIDRNNTSAGSVTALTNRYKVGDSVTVTATTNIGYTWVGWYNGEQEITKELSYTFTMPAENVTYTAKWTYYTLTLTNTTGGSISCSNITHTLSFNLNGGSGSIPSQTSTAEVGLTYPNIPTRSRYVFGGWYNNSNCTGKPFDFSAVLVADTTLYAKWISYSGTGVLPLNGSLSVSVVSKSSSTMQYYAFVPLVSGNITVYTTGSLDTYGYLYNSSKSQLTYDDDNGNGNNFSITYAVTAGVLYYIRPCGYSDSGTTTLYLTADMPIAGGTAIGGGSGKVTVGESVTVKATTNDGYTWLGWYDGERELTKELSYTFDMPDENVTYTAKWIKVTVDRNNTSAGRVTSLTNRYKVGDRITITAITNSGYTWLGWYNGEQEITKELSYTFDMPDENVTYTAKWTYYTVTTAKNSKEAGTVTNYYNTKVTVGNSVTITADTNQGYTWVGWYNGEQEISKELSYTFDMPAANITYAAKWIMKDEMSNFIFTSTPTTCTITGIKDKTVETINVPSYVTNISSGVFSSCSRLETITVDSENCIYHNDGNCLIETLSKTLILGCKSSVIPIDGSVTSIGDSAFYGCIGLSEITIGNSVTSIGGYAFYNCSGLTSVTIPNSVTSIGNYAFYNCSGLTSVTIGNSVTSIGSSAFSGCSKLTSVTVPNSVTSIGSGAFSGCSKLTSITLPFVGGSRKTASDTYQYPFGYIFGTSSYTGGTAVEQNYYGSSTSIRTSTTYYIPTTLKNVTITGGNILYGAFYNCSSLTSITIGDSVTSIGSSAFSGCSDLSEITLPFVGGSRKDASDTYQYPFGYIFGTSSYTGGTYTAQNYYGSSTSSTTSTTYYIPTTLKNVTITGGNILYGAFRNCSSLSEITIPDSVTSIGEFAFYGCSSLTSITIPDSVTSIGNYAFDGCSSLTSITIPDSVTSIGGGAFEGCSSLTSVTIPDGVTSIGSWTFSGCRGLTSVTIGNGVTSIGSWAFDDCRGLTSVTIGSSVTYIGSYAFKLCEKLMRVYYKGDIASWCKISFDDSSANPFYYASKLYINNQLVTTLVIPDSVTKINAYAFYDCSGLTSVTIPNSVTSIGNYAFYDCSGLTSVTIPNSVTSIGDSAFSGCRGLTSVYYKGTASDWSNISISGTGDSYPTSATCYYYSETKPPLNSEGTDYDGNYWYYDDENNIVVWKQED